jgi:hypothetical protein
MRHLLSCAALLAGLVALGTRAEAQNYPWCAVLNMGEWASNCGFVTEQQCRTSVSGIGGFCMPNTTYGPAAPVQTRREGRRSSARF